MTSTILLCLLLAAILKIATASTCPSCSSGYCYCSSQSAYVSCSSCTIGPTYVPSAAPTLLPGSATQITTIAGSYGGAKGYAINNGAATSALFNNIQAMVTDISGNVYICDMSNHIVRKVIQSSGIIVTVAGIQGESGTDGDKGLATSSKLNKPRGIAIDSSGNLYISDSSNYAIRKITTVGTGIISTYVGTLGSQGSATGTVTVASARYHFYEIISTNTNPYAYPISHMNCTPSQLLSLIYYNRDPNFILSHNRLTGPYGICFGPDGTLYFADNYAVKMISAGPPLSVVVFAGTAGTGSYYYGDNNVATSAYFDKTPCSLWMDTSSNMFISDYGNYVIRKVSSTKIITTYAGMCTHIFIHHFISTQFLSYTCTSFIHTYPLKYFSVTQDLIMLIVTDLTEIWQTRYGWIIPLELMVIRSEICILRRQEWVYDMCNDQAVNCILLLERVVKGILVIWVLPQMHYWKDLPPYVSMQTTMCILPMLVH